MAFTLSSTDVVPPPNSSMTSSFVNFCSWKQVSLQVSVSMSGFHVMMLEKMPLESDVNGPKKDCFFTLTPTLQGVSHFEDR